MNDAEFDKYAEQYDAMLRGSIGASGESPDFFARYKVEDMANVITRLQPNFTMQQVLDFGGGIGQSLPHLRRTFPDAAITLADVSIQSTKYADRLALPNVKTMCFDGKSLPLPEHQFDAALAACVFHHIPAEEHIHLLGELRRVLKPTRPLFVFEHNPWNPLTRRVVNNCPFDENAVLISGREMAKRLRMAGYRHVQLAWRVFFPGPLRHLRPLERWMSWLPLGAQYRVVGLA